VVEQPFRGEPLDAAMIHIEERASHSGRDHLIKFIVET
jgi:hypothetical protein